MRRGRDHRTPKRAQARLFAEYASKSLDAPPKESGIAAKLTIGGVALAIAAAALAIFAVFQPAFRPGIHTPVFTEVDENTMLQKETGWPIIVCAIGIIGSVSLYCLDKRRGTIWAMLVVGLGAAIFGATVYQVTGGRDEIEGGSDLLVLVREFHGSLAFGLYAAKAAGLLAAVSGLMLTDFSLRPPNRAVSAISRVLGSRAVGSRVAELRGHPQGH